MKNIRLIPNGMATAILGLLACWQTQAVTLDKSFAAQPFLDTHLGGTTLAARSELAGVVLEDVLQPFSFLGVSGTVQNRVVRENGTGTLDFYWRIKVDPAVPGVSNGGAISAFRLGDFGYSSITDADWRIDGLGTAAPYVGRVFNPTGRPDGAINFLFTDALVLPGDPADGASGSRFFFLHTDASDYAKIASYDLLDAQQNLSQSFSTFAPSRGVPDSGSTAILLLAAMGSLTMASRSRGNPRLKQRF